jgi:choline dehydrogenase
MTTFVANFHRSVFMGSGFAGQRPRPGMTGMDMIAEQCDYVIAGAGSAGCVLADRLSADGRYRVVLLEAGGKDRNPWIHIPLGYGRTMFDARVNWMFETEPEPGLDQRTVKQPRGKVLGGSSSINGLIYVRGQAQDYDHWRDLGNPGWGFADVLPYFKKSEDQARGADVWHGAGGPLAVGDLPEPHPVAEAFVAAGVSVGIPYTRDFNGEQQEGVGYYQATARRGLRCSAGVAFLRPARRRPNLRLITGAHATRILFDGLRACGIAYRAGNDERHMLAAKEVILAAGALQSPQLLRLSGIGPAELLRKHGIPVVSDRKGVGANLQDHLQARFILECKHRITLNDDMQSVTRMARASLSYALFRKGPLGWWAGLAGGFARTRPELDRPDVQLLLMPFSTERVDRKLHAFSGFTLSMCKLRPQSRGTLRIRSADPLAAPAIQVNYLTDPRDLETMIAGVKLVRRILAAPALASIIARERDPGPQCASDTDIAAFVRAKGISVYHPVGTCRMGPDADAVVDPELRMRGASGLRVVDASIMPALVSGNTNAAAILIGEKGADLILQSAERANWPAGRAAA